MKSNEDSRLSDRHKALIAKHRSLDQQVERLSKDPKTPWEKLVSLKRKKLLLKDRITQLAVQLGIAETSALAA